MEITRRQFLKTAGAAAAAAALATPRAAEASAEHFEGYPERYAVLADTTLCIGLNCRRCELACAKENDLPPLAQPPEDETVFLEPRRPSEHQFTVVNRYPHPAGADQHPIYVKKQCMHCDEPACASACFVKALRKTKEGAVVYDASVCVGCRYCMVACPFNIPAYEYHSALHPRVRKCTMCWASKSSRGERPACAQACPKEVMTFGKREDLIRLAQQKMLDNPGRYEQHLYGEHEAGGTCWMYLTPVPAEQLGFPQLGPTPLPEYTRNYLSAAPLIMGIWPVMFGGLYLFSKRRDELARQNDAQGHGEHRSGKEQH